MHVRTSCVLPLAFIVNNFEKKGRKKVEKRKKKMEKLNRK